MAAYLSAMGFALLLFVDLTCEAEGTARSNRAWILNPVHVADGPPESD